MADGQVVVSYQQGGRLGWKSTKYPDHGFFDIAPTSRLDARRRQADIMISALPTIRPLKAFVPTAQTQGSGFGVCSRLRGEI
jgi:hypothetical protein